MPLIDLTLRPNRSLDRRHARWLIIGVGGVFLLGGLRFLVVGAWPVIPFMVIDVALLWWALRASYRSGRAYEAVRLDEVSLTVRKVSHMGRERRFRLEPYWAKAQLERLSTDENRLSVASRGVSVTVGQCLSPAEREAVHAVIVDGLARWRQSPSTSLIV
ncbi:DUF2244 domain-containing protein [Glacieibacterium sp.]|uniref:DUF2244 domain-containing protein n=1 Tax=Glacieibacterium sp. TaxID=2860237 RepID=UPI003B00474C